MGKTEIKGDANPVQLLNLILISFIQGLFGYRLLIKVIYTPTYLYILDTKDVLKVESRIAKVHRIEILSKFRTIDVGDI